MKIEMGKQYGTRGNPTVAVKIESVVTGSEPKVFGYVMKQGRYLGYGPNTWSLDGRFWNNLTRQHSLDLVPLVVDEPEVAPREIYINLDEDGNLCATYYREDGYAHRRARFVEVVEPKPLSGTVIRWVNIYDGGTFMGHHKTRKQADQVADTSRLACVKITVPWVEGQSDE